MLVNLLIGLGMLASPLFGSLEEEPYSMSYTENITLEEAEFYILQNQPLLAIETLQKGMTSLHSDRV